MFWRNPLITSFLSRAPPTSQSSCRKNEDIPDRLSLALQISHFCPGFAGIQDPFGVHTHRLFGDNEWYSCFISRGKTNPIEPTLSDVFLLLCMAFPAVY